MQEPTESPGNVGDVTISLRAVDIDESDFYCEVLGFEIEVDGSYDLGAGWVAARNTRLRLKDNRSVSLGLMQADAPNSASRAEAILFTIRVADCADVLRRLSRRDKAHDAVVDHGSLPYGEYVTLRDPFGNIIQAMEEF